MLSAEPLSFFRLEEALRLSDEEKLIGPRGRTPPVGQDVPEIEALEQLDERAGAYDGTLPRLAVEIEPAALEGMLTSALERELEIATAFGERLQLGAATGPVSPLGLILLVPSRPDADGWAMRGEPWCAWAWHRAPSTAVTVRALDQIGSPFERAATGVLEGAGLVLDENYVSYGWSQMHSWLAEVLGFRTECIVPRWPA